MKKHKLYIAILFLFLISCKKDNLVEWDSTNIIPLFKGKIGISDIIDDSLFTTSEGGNVTFVFSQSIYKLPASEILEIKETDISKTISLETLTLGNRQIENKYTMGDVARDIGGFTGAYILSQHGNSIVIPPFNGLGGDIDIDATEFFQTATFKDGNLELVIHNGFEIDLTNIEFSLENKIDKQVIFVENIPVIEAGNTFKENYSLVEKTLEGEMLARIINMDSPGSDGEAVPVDTNDAIVIRLIASNMDLYSATAIFPAQSLFNTNEDVVYDMGGAEITEMKVRSGHINIKSFNTINDSVFLYYTVPSAIKDGKQLEVRSSVPPGTPQSAAILNKNVSIAGYVIDYTGENNDKVNTFSNYLDVSIDSSGKLISISLDDSIQIHYGLYDIIPEYAYGYMGEHHFSLQLDTAIDFFNRNFSNSSFKFEYIDVRIVLKNGTGIRAAVKINKITAGNSKDGKQVNLTFPDLGQEFTLGQANESNMEPYVKTLEINSDNSNINSFFEILPDHTSYDIEISLNPQGNNLLYDDFIYYDNDLEALLELEIPLNLSSDELIFEKQLDYNFDIDKKVIEQLQGVTLNIDYINKFPFDAEIELFILDKNQNTVAILQNENNLNLLKAAKDPDAGGRMKTPAVDVLKFQLNKEQIHELINNNLLLLKVRLNTTTNSYVKIFSDYDLDFNVNAELIYRMKTGRNVK